MGKRIELTEVYRPKRESVPRLPKLERALVNAALEQTPSIELEPVLRKTVIAEFHYLGKPELPQPNGYALVNIGADAVLARKRALKAAQMRRYRSKKKLG